MLSDINWVLIGAFLLINIMVLYFVIKWAVYSALNAYEKDKSKDKERSSSET